MTLYLQILAHHGVITKRRARIADMRGSDDFSRCQRGVQRRQIVLANLRLHCTEGRLRRPGGPILTMEQQIMMCVNFMIDDTHNTYADAFDLSRVLGIGPTRSNIYAAILAGTVDLTSLGVILNAGQDNSPRGKPATPSTILASWSRTACRRLTSCRPLSP